MEKVGVEVHVRTEAWAKERKMNAFLAVSKGSNEPPIFLELNYKGAAEGKPLALVGKYGTSRMFLKFLLQSDLYHEISY